MTETLKVGSRLPKFTIKDFEGEPVTQDDLLGIPFVLYFYPKNDTPGCTKEACSFRDFMPTFDDLEFIVIGVSSDNPDSHQKFMEKYELNFPLLSDENLELSKQFGIVKEKTNDAGKPALSVERSTFIIDEEGVIQWVESPVKVDGHVDRVVQAIEEIFA